jgi:hypothetical protein
MYEYYYIRFIMHICLSENNTEIRNKENLNDFHKAIILKEHVHTLCSTTNIFNYVYYVLLLPLFKKNNALIMPPSSTLDNYKILKRCVFMVNICDYCSTSFSVFKESFSLKLQGVFFIYDVHITIFKKFIAITSFAFFFTKY